MNETIEHGIDPALVEALLAAAAHPTEPAGALTTVLHLATAAGRTPAGLRASVQAAHDTATGDRARQALHASLDGLTGPVPAPRPYL
ncbi:hypothetical protein [Actinokineospora spheciospongiae]|uniref:hypothetical protein n=1 Tax=Actinokineospora spheciospongiae TaxID=909613 RepID=UPI000D716961|nr:hypothetical protein [Actinokineospora spheciospongiae]PWW62227.1 hypothetical protein DFQ13_10537 [Actinokineospora spheciospongiae]